MAYCNYCNKNTKHVKLHREMYNPADYFECFRCGTTRELIKEYDHEQDSDDGLPDVSARQQLGAVCPYY